MSQNSELAIVVSQCGLPDDLAFTDLFAPYAEQPWAILFDSGDSQHPDSRYHIMAVEPKATLSFEGRQCLHRNVSGDTQHFECDDPMSTIERVLGETLSEAVKTARQSVDITLPFTVGAAGLFGYDAGRIYEALPEHAENDISAPDIAVGIYDWSLIYDRQLDQLSLVAAQGSEAPSFEHLFERARHNRVQITHDFRLDSPWQSNMTASDYQHKLERIHHYLVEGDCYQVNLAQRFTAQYSGSLWRAYDKLRQTNSAPFSAFMRLPEHCVLSVSPERFLQVQQGTVETKPIKGTMPRHSDPAIDETNAQALLTSEKDRAENLMIVDLLRNDISKNCRDHTVEVPDLFKLESFPAVHHLVSRVVGELAPNRSALDLLRDAFPGGSITGAPKIRAMEIIDELEPHRRNIYCGSMGYLDVGGDMDTSICIRTLLAQDNTLYCWAGGGIVLDSNADDEYQECFDKVRKILPVLEDMS